MRFGVVLAVAAGLVWPAAGQAADLRIIHVTIVSPERKAPLRDATVTVRDGRIAAIATGAVPKDRMATLDAKGLYLTPGLIDSHVHLGGIPGMDDAQERKYPALARAAHAQIPRSYLLYGFTTVIDLASTRKEIARWKAHPVVPDVYFCGAAPVMDGYPMNWMPKPARYKMVPYMLIEPGIAAPPGIDPSQHTPDAVVARMKADGAACVKTFYESGFGPVKNLPVPRLETVRNLVRAAHARNMPVLMHGNSAEAWAFAPKAGVDILAHGLWNWGAVKPGTAIFDDVLAAHIGWQSTIQVLYGERDLFSTSFLSNPELARTMPASLLAWYRTPEAQGFHDMLAANLKAKDRSPKSLEKEMFGKYEQPIESVTRGTGYLVSHGGRLLFGTDTPSAPTYTNLPGLNGWLEINNLTKAGVTPAQIFQAATLSNAKALRLDREIGTVEVGKRANLLLLREDPNQTIQAWRGIDKVILGGRVLEPSALAANTSQP